MVNRFTSRAQLCLTSAKKNAEKMGHTYIGTEHLLLGIALTDCVGARLLEEKKVTDAQIREKIIDISGVGSSMQLSCNELTPKAKKVIEASSAAAKRHSFKLIGSEHILYAIVDDGENVGARILLSLGINLSVFKNEIASVLDATGEQKSSKKSSIPGSPTLSLYGKNLNLMAKGNKTDPLIGRDKEISRLIQILSRRTKNNPCLIGEPGVGKTAIVEGLAKRICDGDVPENLRDKTIVSLDLSSMIAGAKYRGEFEERMKGIMNELKNNDSLILFIDELHTIIGAGAAEGAVDAANIIKPALSRSELHLIGATTTPEYRRYIEKDAALERRFQPLLISEPSPMESIEILNGLRSRYEEFHGVKITDDAISAAVYLSARYINDRFLPDKAIDLIDEACSFVKMKNQEKPPKHKELLARLRELSARKEEAILNERFGDASRIRQKEAQLEEEYARETKKWESNLQKTQMKIDGDVIAKIVTEWTSIPIASLEKNENERLSKLESGLSNKIIGQSEAVKLISSSIKRSRAGLKNPTRPIGTFMFLGPTGVGKTLLAKAIAEEIFGSEGHLIRLDMSEYMEKHSISKLIGSPPGYVGYEEGGQLTARVRTRPYSVILFDEIEKAHPDIYNLLLQILDEGKLSDSQGRMIDFKNTVIILTSNVGARSITEPHKTGFFTGGDNEESENTRAKINEALKNQFSPEFLNRLDEIIIFNRLSPDDAKKIALQMVKEIIDLASGIGIELKIDESAISFIAKTHYSKQFGARPIRRAIVNLIENPLSEKIISEEIKKGDTVSVITTDGELVFKINEGATI